MKSFILLLIICLYRCGDTNAWKQRTVYQILTDRFARSNGDQSQCNVMNYCGGTWDGITQNLQYVKDLGFDAIWISPIVDNIDGGYHGYWAANWEKVNSNFGNSDSLKNLINIAHSMDIWVMVDVVANHVGPVGFDYSRIYPFNQASHYHDNCDIKDWNNQDQVENCRLAGLPDLNQNNQYVRDYLKKWIQQIVQTYSFDGIRIDTIPEIHKDFWKEFGQASGVFQMGEVFNGDPRYVGDYQNYLTGLFNYPMYYTIRDVFMNGQSMVQIDNRYQEEQNSFKDIDALGLFVDNHDNARFLSQNGNYNKFKSALAFALVGKGIPFFYYGSEQGFHGGNDPYNREPIWSNFNKNHEIYLFIKTLNSARNAAKSQQQTFIQRGSQNNFYSLSRGDLYVALTNQMGDQQFNVSNHPYSNGQLVCNIFYATDCVQIDNNHNLKVYLNNGETKVFLPKSHIFFNQSFE